MLAQRLCKDLSTDPRPDAIRDCGGILVERDWEYGEKPGYRISFIDQCWRLDPEEHDPGATAARIFSKGQAVRVESS